MTTKISGTTGIDRVEPTAAGLPLSFRNKIINGKMELAQRGVSGGASFPFAITYGTVDRWAYTGIGSSGTATISREDDTPLGGEFQHSLRWTQTTATPIAADSYGLIVQRIEGYNARDLIGKTFTISFRVRSSKTGIHCVALRNSGTDRSAVFEYTISQANTWETKSVTVAGGLISSGTWNWQVGIGLDVIFTLGCGSQFATSTVGEWVTGNFKCTPNQVNCLDAAGNIFAITGVQLEVGEVATTFEHRPIGLEQSLCERYYEVAPCPHYYLIGGTGATGNPVVYLPLTFATRKRTTPSIAYSGPLTNLLWSTGGSDLSATSIAIRAAGTTDASISFLSGGTPIGGVKSTSDSGLVFRISAEL